MRDGVDFLQQTFNSDECKGVVAFSDVWLGSPDRTTELLLAREQDCLMMLVSFRPLGRLHNFVKLGNSR